ncbi:MAG: hypothetical protein IPK16_09700 [Anaerolineales bacterium]|nr:hypothetical protein [Anaerolineales bacterium]
MTATAATTPADATAVKPAATEEVTEEATEEATATAETTEEATAEATPTEAPAAAASGEVTATVAATPEGAAPAIMPVGSTIRIMVRAPRILAYAGPSITSGMVGSIANQTEWQVLETSPDGLWVRVNYPSADPGAWIWASSVVGESSLREMTTRRPDLAV